MYAPATLVRATAQLQYDAASSSSDEFTIGNIMYTVIDTPAAGYDVDETTSITVGNTNLIAAIMKSGGGATSYYETDTLISPFMSASAAATDQMLLTARVPGTAGNGIYLLSSEADIDFEEVGDTATLFSTAGTGLLETALQSLLDEVQLNSEAIQMVAHLTSRSTD